MKFQTHNDSPSINTRLTRMQGHIQATRAELEKTFGKPEESDDQGSDGKIKLYWAIQFADGTVATIYDWNQNQAPGMDEVFAYNIAGHVPSAVFCVHEAFRVHHGFVGSMIRKAA